ncbi:FAD-binding oxidoreductase [Streptomyces sp. KL118A]|uniref:NAD(P)/FAD-dependent oxidoreductase n=1 Tax=Streptomyces sp. KL118A TaxID=3045153 RepID=UPI00278C02DB|nr:FAD-binding oxidoreductase [Streptomyces sp. KL118A]
MVHDVIVVGAGMFGSAAAKYLGRAGADTLIVGPAEPQRLDAAVGLPDFGAHYDESRIARCLGWDRFWGTADTRSTARYRDIEAESGIGFFTECGSLALVSAAQGDRTEAMLRAAGDDGVAVERMPAAELRREFPALRAPSLTGGVEGLLERKDAGRLDPRRLVRAQLELALSSGARLVRGAVTSLHRQERTGHWKVRVQDDDGGFHAEAETVLLATGSLINHSDALPARHAVDLQVFTEPNLLFEVADDHLDRLRHLPTVVIIDPDDTGDGNLSAYLIPPLRYPDGKWYARIGPAMQPVVRELRTAEEIHSWYAQQRITKEQSAFLNRMAHLLLPGLEPVSVREACCVVDKTRTRYPYIGHLDADRTLSVVVGGNGHGARGSDEIGRLAATVVLDEPWDFPVPRGTLAPVPARPDDTCRAGYLQPPFGLC